MENYVINPKTSRLIKIGGAVHKKLMREGVMERLEKKDKVRFEIKKDATDEEVEQMKQNLTKNVPRNKKVVKSRGGGSLELRQRSADPYFYEVIDELLSDRGLEGDGESPAGTPRRPRGLKGGFSPFRGLEGDGESPAGTPRRPRGLKGDQKGTESPLPSTLEKPKLTRQSGYYKVRESRPE